MNHNSNTSLGQENNPVRTEKCCAWTDCNLDENLRLCSRCKLTYYCCKDHQILHWKTHKKECCRRSGSGLAEGAASHSLVVTTSTTTTSATTITTTTSTSNEPSTHSSGTESALGKTQSGHQKKVPPDVHQKKSGNGMQRTFKLGDLNLASTTASLTSEGETESSPVMGHVGSVDVEESRTFSHSIIHSNSYPLTPLSEQDDDESEENTKESSDSTPAGRVGWQAGASEPSIPRGPSRYPPGKIGITNQSREWLEKLTNYMVECLHRCGLCVIDRVLGVERGETILKEVLKLHQQDKFNDGQLVKNTSAGKGTIRGDKIMWTDGVKPPCANIRWLISQMDTIVMRTNGHFKNVNIESRTKAMVACYPSGGTRYVKHVDNPNQDGRVITCIYYLNKKWNSKEEGGLLKIYPRGLDHVANIEPIFDRLIFFWSDMRNPHEVLPAYRTRYAITVWYFDTRERKAAREKHMSKIQDKMSAAGQQTTNQHHP